MLIEQILPEYDEREYHEIQILGSPKRVYNSVRSLDFSHSSTIRHLFRLRGMEASSMRLDDLLNVGFVVVAEVPDEEFVLGLVGKFWTPTGKIEKVDAVQYREFKRSGYAKAAWNFAIHQTGPDTVRLSTETRVKCTDDHSRRLFRLYWLLIGPFSGWIRKEILRGVKRRIELGRYKG
jgi:hypothetical protein